jgi:uncharacterized membrane protein YgdD (TMEM256/DUF423 family)
MRRFVALGAICAFLAVAFGAFGAHALKDKMTAANLEVYKTAVQYHFFHSLAILIVGAFIVQMRPFEKLLNVVGWLFLAGIVLFSGSLYALAITDIKVLGAITPLGGLCFLTGWACLAVAALRRKDSDATEV